jgi:hypothetical protein
MQKTVISFDIDGTLEAGDPPGPITMDFAVMVASAGHIIGSASDRTLRGQSDLWTSHNITPSFVTHKHHLDQVARQYPGARLVHIGDTDIDGHFARLAGFEFYPVKDGQYFCPSFKWLGL